MFLISAGKKMIDPSRFFMSNEDKFFLLLLGQQMRNLP